MGASSNQPFTRARNVRSDQKAIATRMRAAFGWRLVLLQFLVTREQFVHRFIDATPRLFRGRLRCLREQQIHLTTQLNDESFGPRFLISGAGFGDLANGDHHVSHGNA